MLDIRYGIAAKSHENVFFRTFSQSLKDYFDSHAIDGLLLGFPRCRVREDLQIDALLITDSSMIIIDFKDYSGTLILPDEANFKRGPWKLSNGLIVKGGSSPNPFYQLGLQRERLGDLLRMTARNLTKFDPRHISTLVCFTEPVKVDGSIPGNFKLSFFIANADSYLEKIFDIINVEENVHDLLSDDFLKLLNNKLFESDPYDCFITPVHVEEADQKEATPQNETSTTVLDSDICVQITNFMKSSDDVLIITGTVGSGKHSLAERIRESAYSAGFASARLFALSNRVKNNLMSSIEEVESLYATIYDFNKKEIDSQTGKEIIPLASFSPIDAFEDLTPQENSEELKSVFIVYESQMITNTYRDDGTVRFGSGELLKDLLDYLGIVTSTKTNKVVFVGDKFQLGFGSWSQSSLNPAAYHEGIKVSSIDLPDVEDPNGIECICLDIADSMRAEDYSELVIAPNEMVDLNPMESEGSLVDAVVKNWTTHKIIAYSNAKTYDINSYIKRKVIHNGSQLGANDLIIFNNQIFAYPAGPNLPGQVPAFDAPEPIRIENGSFGVIQSVGGLTLTRSYTFTDLDDPVTLSLIQADVKLESGRVVSVEALKEYLYAKQADLSDYEEQAMQILLKELLASYEKTHPFAPGDPDFDEMIRSGNYVKTENGRYRDKDDTRRLTTYETRHRERIARKLTADPSSEYFRWLNAARIKFGWCITVHKAMSYKWPHVVFDTAYDQGKNNREYFKFVYTGISRASENVNLVRWKNLSPFSNTVFAGEATSIGKSKRSVVATIDESTPNEIVKRLLYRVLDENTKIVSIKSKNYLEIVRLQRDEAQAALGFDYNGKGEIRSPRLLNGDSRLFEAVVNLLSLGEEETATSPLGQLYDHLNHDVLNGISLVLVQSYQYQDRMILEAEGARTEVRVIYNKHKLITKLERISGSEDLFNKTVDAITAYYDWELR